MIFREGGKGAVPSARANNESVGREAEVVLS
jgi:hypothetical protein